MAIEPAATSATPAVTITAFDTTPPERPAASANGTVSPSDIPMTRSRTVSLPRKWRSTCGVCGMALLSLTVGRTARRRELPAREDDGLPPVRAEGREQRAEEGRPEAVDLEALDQRRGEPEAEAVEDEQEEPERHQREGQGQDHQDRADDGVDEAEDEPRPQRGEGAAQLDPRHDGRGG